MSEPNHLFETDGRGVATLTLNRPDLHNAFDEILIADLTAALQRLETDEAVRVVILTGSGKSFSAGADLNWMKRMSGYSEAENLADAGALGELLKTLHGLSKPTIARVNGAAFGGGVGLISACDIAIGADNAVFSISEVKLGLIFAVISPYVIAAMSQRQTRRYALTAERFDAGEAERVGLLHRTVPQSELNDAVNEVADSLLANSPAAMAETKSLIDAVMNRPINAGVIADTAARIARVRASDEGKEGISAFLEKRKPGWTQR